MGRQGSAQGIEQELAETGHLAIEAAEGLARGMAGRIREAFGTEAPPTPAESAARGKALRERLPRSAQGDWQPAPDRPDPVALLREQGRDRLQDLLPLRYERMAASAFAFFRGAALVMASDLSRLPTTGIRVQCCGDAHISNFGLFNSPERRTVFDINDFDETLPGPWEWDVRRLVASVEVLGRDRGLAEGDRAQMVAACAAGYREGMRAFASMGHLDVWYAHLDVEALLDALEASKAKVPARDLREAGRELEKARGKDSARALSKLTEVVDGRLRVVSNPPTVVPLRELVASSGRVDGKALDGLDVAKAIGRVLAEYRLTLPTSARRLVERYEGVDIARKVVGVGSVGTRAWVVVMRGASNDDPLVLQVKEAQESVLERYLGKSAYREHGQRVVEGQRAMQTVGDLLLGWCRLPGEDGRKKDYYVRQLWDGKGSVDLARLDVAGLTALARACGWTLAHAHARTGDRFAIAGYLGKKDAFDRAMVRFASVYADQNEADYRRFLAARESGELPLGTDGATAT